MVLQYTVYAVMMPFFGMGGDQLADSWLGESGMGDTERARGDDGTVEMSNLVMHRQWFLYQFDQMMEKEERGKNIY